MSLRARLLPFVALLAGLSACEAPPVVASQDPTQQEANTTTRIEGSVVVVGKTRGNVLVLMYDVANPPPPQGTGRPLAFTLIPEAEVFGSNTDPSNNGPFTAPFIFSRVRPGQYLLRGLIDHDECAGQAADSGCHGPDFIPWFSVTNEPNHLDVGGAAVDPVKGTARVVEVKDVSAPVTGVSVSFNDAVPGTTFVDRPAFSVTGTGTFNPTGGTKLLDLNVFPLADKTVDERQPVFLARYVDDNNDGQPDDVNKDGVPEFWPKVFVRKLASDDPYNLTDETGVHYDRDVTAPPAPAEGSDVVVLAAGLVNVIPQLNDTSGNPKRDANGALATVPLTSLKLALQGAAYDARNPLAPARLKSVPSGRYAIIVENFTGQTWRVPNELEPNYVAATFTGDFKLPAQDTQVFVIEVP